jgi:dTDP-4-dehydrorhamnose 3,5-epimerase
VKIRELSISGAWEFTPVQHRDERGVFLEFYRHEALQEAAGHPLALRQGNMSVSAKGVARGIHYALVPPGQAKYVTAVRGAFVDYVIDLRVGSPTFGEWDSVVIDDEDRRAVYISEGLGHAIVSLTDNATVSYLVSEVFNAQRELGISVFDPEIGLTFPDGLGELQVSPKDRDAPGLSEALRDGLLPTWADSRALYSDLDGTV